MRASDDACQHGFQFFANQSGANRLTAAQRSAAPQQRICGAAAEAAATATTAGTTNMKNAMCWSSANRKSTTQRMFDDDLLSQR